MAGGIGRVFTPLAWARWAVREFGLLGPWLEGAEVLDPTMGDGALLEALVLEALAGGRTAAGLPVGGLFGVEIDEAPAAAFLLRMRTAYGLKVPERNIVVGDFLLLPRERLPVCPILFGNPPWSTFADLPESYKPAVKEKFLAYGLVKSRRSVLLGRSRADIAGLVAAKALAENLRPRGRAVFFLPLSLFSAGGANGEFSHGRPGDAAFSVERVVDLTDRRVFPGVATRYGAALLVRDAGDGGTEAGPDPSPGVVAGRGTGPDAGPEADPDAGRGHRKSPRWEPIPISPASRPRQGINTGGANDIFIFDEKTPAGDGGCLLANRFRSGVLLPEKHLYPLATAANFREEVPIPRKWVFLPYRRDGRPLGFEELRREPPAEAYLSRMKDRLEARKGVFLRSLMRGGRYWALLGVGPYSFGEWKILWEACGRSFWLPKIFPGRWQANQALQCGMSFSDRGECEEVFRRLSDERVEAYLRSFGTAGGMNWAQPGKIQKLLTSCYNPGDGEGAHSFPAEGHRGAGR